MESVADHPGAHGGKHFLALGSVEEFGFFNVAITTAVFAVLLVVLPPVVVGHKGFVAGFFIGGAGESFILVHQ